MMQELLQQQKRALEHYFSEIEVSKLEDILHLLQKSPGKLLFSGVGKSGFIARKLAATFLSIGSQSYFLSPLDALHGDLGMVEEGDLLFCFSKSGKTQELLQLIPCVQAKKAKVISFVCEKASPIEERSDMSILLPCLSELCPNTLVPTISATLQLLVGDALAIALMQKKRFSMGNYSLNHPGGVIGKKITQKVRDLMKPAPLAYLEATLEGSLEEFSRWQCGCLVIVDKQNHLRGIFTDGDLRRALQKEGASFMKKSCQELMNPSPKWIGPEELVFFALQTMEKPENPILVLPVVEDLKVVGILRMHDILQEGLR